MNPILVIGMHRSGTGLLTELLDRVGVFMGARLDSSHESTFFQNLNRWILSQASSYWDQPEPIDDLLRADDLREAVRDYLDLVLASPRSVSYLGALRYLRNRDPRNLDSPWGWKDPRTTFTLPVWEDVVGPVNVVHILRHGVDVAKSLRDRRDARLQRRVEAFELLGPLAWVKLPRNRFAESARTGDLEEGLTLWKRYVHRARHHLNRTEHNAIEVRYEELLRSPEKTLTSIVNDLEVDVEASHISDAAEIVDPSRAFSYREDEGLRHFAREHREEIRSQGYDP